MTTGPDGGTERERMEDAGHLEEGLERGEPVVPVGALLSPSAAWGSVREDYSADGDAWASFPHDHARSRAYRWNEDGMAGISDVFRRLNLALALWNGKDPILKERMFGLTNARATMARTSRSTGGTSTRCPAARGCAGATTTRRRRSRTRT